MTTHLFFMGILKKLMKIKTISTFLFSYRPEASRLTRFSYGISFLTQFGLKLPVKTFGPQKSGNLKLLVSFRVLNIRCYIVSTSLFVFRRKNSRNDITPKFMSIYPCHHAVHLTDLARTERATLNNLQIQYRIMNNLWPLSNLPMKTTKIQ